MVEAMLMAVALGMDSFSLSVGLGCQGLKRGKIWLLTALVGIFHVLLPLLGLWLGRQAGQHLGMVATYIGAFILLFLGGKMILEARSNGGEGCPPFSGWQILLIPLAVSVDALTVGFSLGTFGFGFFRMVLLFGLVAALMTLGGVFLGDRVGRFVTSSGYLAGIILIALGLVGLFS